jgi:hypothetical protein
MDGGYQFFDPGMGAKEIFAIFLIGFLATTFMFGLRWVALRYGLVPRTRVQGVGAFLIPEPINDPLTEWLFHTVGGMAFAFVYAYIFSYVDPANMSMFLAVGAVLGLVHGYFITFFILLGFSGLRASSVVGRFTISGPLMNIVAHVSFGALVGMGYGSAELSGRILPFAATVAALEIILASAVFMVAPRNVQHDDEHQVAAANHS